MFLSSRWLVFLLGFMIIFSSFGLALSNSTIGHFVPLLGLSSPAPSYASLLVRQEVFRQVWENENASFLRSRYGAANASSVEKSFLDNQLNGQRTNLLHAHLNGVVLDAQKVDFLLKSFSVSLLRLHIAYEAKRRTGTIIPSFDSRYAELDDSLSQLLESQSRFEGDLFLGLQQNAESRESIERLQVESSRQLLGLQGWMGRYRELLHDVVSN